MVAEAAFAAGSMREALVVLASAAIVIPLFHRLRISAVLGFMLVGAAVGPSGLGAASEALPWLRAVTIQDRERIAPLAEFGVVLLLFMIGLELSFERILTMRRLVFGLGASQVAACQESSTEVSSNSKSPKPASTTICRAWAGSCAGGASSAYSGWIGQTWWFSATWPRPL